MDTTNLISPNTGKPYSKFDYIGYSLNWLNQAPQMTGIQATAIINTDSDFIVTKLSYWASIATLAQQNNPGLQWMWTDGGSNKDLFDAPFFLEECAGTGQLPFVLPMARRFSAGSTIKGTLYNPSASTFDYVQIQLHGIRCYP